MLDRLTKLIKEAQERYIYAEEQAQYLIDNGVLVAPMPMADWLGQELTEHIHQRCLDEL